MSWSRSSRSPGSDAPRCGRSESATIAALHRGVALDGEEYELRLVREAAQAAAADGEPRRADTVEIEHQRVASKRRPGPHGLGDPAFERWIGPGAGPDLRETCTDDRLRCELEDPVVVVVDPDDGMGAIEDQQRMLDGGEALGGVFVDRQR